MSRSKARHDHKAEVSGSSWRAHAWQRFDVCRSIAFAVVVSMHAGLLLVLLKPARPMRMGGDVRPIDSVNILLVRFISKDVASPLTERKPVRPSLHTEKRHRHKPVPTHAARKSVTSAKQPAGKPRPSAAKTLSLKWHGGGRASDDWTVGRSLSVPRRVAPRLPGGEPVYGAPVVHMVDPRSQGVAGVVRAIAGALGAVDPHCVDVDAWRSMSPAELARHHVSPDQVEKIAERNHCTPPKRGDLSSDPFEH